MPVDVPDKREAVGLIPAAGSGRRIAPLPCSKELYPIGFRRDEGTGTLRPAVVSAHWFDKLRAAGIRKAFIVLRDGKWDIPSYFCDGANFGIDLAYVVIRDSIGPPDTVDRAYPFIADCQVAFGFPDILCGPDDLFERLRNGQRRSNADLVLGLFEAPDCRLADMVDVDSDGCVGRIVLKPARSSLRYTWTCAFWTPAFTRFLQLFMARERAKTGGRNYGEIDPSGDLPVGAVIEAAIATGLHVHGVAFPNESYIDIGTPDNLVAAARELVRSL